MIRVQNLDLDLGGKSILRGISLEIETGSKVAIWGESGSGKTSLLKSFIGLHIPDRGSIHIGGLNLEPANLAEIRKQQFYMPQEVRPIDEETVRDFIDAFFAFKVTKPEQPSEKKIGEVFQSLKLNQNLLSEQMATLSGGERQRVGIARGLILGRELMLLDEVTSAVDSENRNRIVDMFISLPDTTIVAVTHDPRLIEKADVRIEMRGGEVV